MSMIRRLSIIDGTTLNHMEVEVSDPSASREDEYQCCYALHWPYGTEASSMYGVDAIQALNLVFNIVAVKLYSSELHKQGKLFWEKLGDGYGFPLGGHMRDLSEGSDRWL